MDHMEKVIRTALRLRNIDEKDNFVPDYHLHYCANLYQLPIEECRTIRDVVQANRQFNIQGVGPTNADNNFLQDIEASVNKRDC